MASGPSNLSRRAWLRLCVVGIAFAILVYVVIVALADARVLKTSFLGIAPWAPLISAALVLFGYACRATRWHLFLGRLGAAPTWRTSALTYVSGFPLGVSPGRLGEFVKIYYLRREIRISNASALAAMLSERVTDLLSLALLLAFGLLVTNESWAPAGIVVLFMAACGVAFLRHRRSVEVILGGVARVPGLGVIQSFGRATYGDLQLLIRLRWLAVGTLLGLCTWAMETTAMWVLARGMGIAVGFPLCALAMAIGSVAGIISFLPAGLGAKEGGMIGVLALAGVMFSDAAALGIAIRLATLWFGVVIGALAVLWLHTRRPSVKMRTAAPNPLRPPGFDILGVRVSAIDMEDAVRFFDATLDGTTRRHVCVCSVNMIMQARKNGRLFECLRTSDLVTPDGFPLTWIGRRRYGRHVGRVRGTDLVHCVSDLAAKRGVRCFFLGGAPLVPERMAANLQARYPGLIVAGALSPPFGPVSAADNLRIVETINATRPDIVWIGLGCPKQEIWMMDYADQLRSRLVVGVGAAFDFIAGTKREAPRWMQAVGLEWLWRFLGEPKRLWRRVLVEGPQFMALATWQFIREGRATQSPDKEKL